jgi:hypothetical protein
MIIFIVIIQKGAEIAKATAVRWLGGGGTERKAIERILMNGHWEREEREPRNLIMTTKSFLIKGRASCRAESACKYDTRE